METSYLESAIKQFEYYKLLADKAIEQVPGDQLHWQFNEESNSIAVIMKHMYGNMLSRWTDFMTTDGEKEWRNRDSEFENDAMPREELLQKWNEGWDCLFNALRPLREKDLSHIIYIRNQGHTVLEAINRQLAHYPYHVGQIVFIAKMIVGPGWNSLSIPKGRSATFNQEKFSSPRSKVHFTDEYLKDHKKRPGT